MRAPISSIVLALLGQLGVLLAMPADEAHATVLVSEWARDSVVDIEPGGNLAGAPRFATGLDDPFGLCMGPGGEIYVAEFDTGEITIITGGGDFSGAPAFATGLNSPVALYCSATEIWVTEFDFGLGYGEVTEVTSGGDFSGAPAHATGLTDIVAVMRDDTGTLWASCQNPGAIYDITTGGDFSSVPPYAMHSTKGAETRGMVQWNGTLLAANTGTNTVNNWTPGGDMSSDVFATVPSVANVADTTSGLWAVSALEGAVYNITNGGDYTLAMAYATGLDTGGSYAGILQLPCGNGLLDPGEACDDAGESTSCDVDCTAAECGDGLLNPTADEVCDDAGNSATCDVDCTAAACGDGLFNPAAGETCDDAGNSASCDNDCTAAECGDGLLNPAAGEVCDDGNALDGDGCSARCAYEDDPTTDGDSADADTGSTGLDTSDSSDSDPDPDSTGPGVTDSTESGDTPITSAGDTTTGEPTSAEDGGLGTDDPGGCGCRQRPAGDPAGALMLGLLGLLAAPRRRG